MYQGRISQSLATYGLRYEDCLIERPDVAEAITLSSPDVIVGRNRRHKRAMDLSFKKKDLKIYAPEMTTDAVLQPLAFDIIPLAEAIKARDEEKYMLNKGW